MRRRLPDVLALALAVVAAIASAWVSASYFERIPHLEDEFANLWEADVMATGRIALPSPPQPESFLVPFVVDHDGLRFGKYPRVSGGAVARCAGWRALAGQCAPGGLLSLADLSAGQPAGRGRRPG